MLGDNPVLAELDGLSPQAKQALQIAHATIAGQPMPGTTPAPAPSPATPTPAPKPIAAAPANRIPTLGPAPELPVNSAQGSPLIGTALPKAPTYTSPQDKELARLTTPPVPGLHDKTQTGLSGIAQIHNPWARIPLQIADAIGSGLFPRIAMGLPGTEAHHELLVHQAQNTVDQNQAAAQNDAKIAQNHALTDEAEARAEALTHPQPKEEEAGKTITTEQGIMQWNPATERYDIPAGKAPEKPEKQPIEHIQDDQGNYWMLHADGSVTPVTANGQQLKGKTPEAKPGSPEQQYIDEYREKHPGSTIADAEKAFKRDTQAPEREPQTMMLVPDGKGGYTAQVIRPGQSVAAGAVTPGGANTENVNEDKSRKAAERAAADAKNEYQLAQNLVAHPSPTNDLALVMRYIGATKPDSLGKLRLNNNEVNLVLHTRSSFGDLEALTEKVRNGQMLTPEQRQDMLATMKILAGGVSSEQPGGHVIEVNGKRYQYNGSGATDDLKNYTEVKR